MLRYKLDRKLRLAYATESVEYESLLSITLPFGQQESFKLGYLSRSCDKLTYPRDIL
jgi:hypothetical protein